MTAQVGRRESALREPIQATVARRPGSARRTSHVDIVPLGRTSRDGLELRGAARDLRTGEDGSALLVAEATVEAELGPERDLRRLEARPDIPALQGLMGLTVRHGFRAELEQAVPGHVADRTPLYLLLDDLPVAALIAGYADMYSEPVRISRDATRKPPVDVCAGWAADAMMMRSARSATSIVITVGPEAPGLDGGDPLAWHAIAALGTGAMRRRRLVDVLAGEVLSVWAMFRDTHVAPDGVERVLHEYEVEAAVEPSSGLVVACDAWPRALPWPECPGAAASSGRLAGRHVADVRAFVSSELRGTTTCTHLNDLLRSLADVVPLARELGVPLPPPRGESARS